MFISSNPNYSARQAGLNVIKCPSFQARFKIDRQARKVLEKDIIRFRDSYFNFGKFFKDLKVGIEEITKNIKGTIRVVMKEGEVDPIIKFETPEGIVWDKSGYGCRMSIGVYEYLRGHKLLPDKMFGNQNKPKFNTVIASLANLEHWNTGESNFKNLSDELSNLKKV